MDAIWYLAPVLLEWSLAHWWEQFHWSYAQPLWKKLARNLWGILRWNVEAEQIGGIHIATKVHSIAWKAYWNLQRKVLAYIALKTWWKLQGKKGGNVVSRVFEPTYKRQNVITPPQPPHPPPWSLHKFYISAQLLHDVQNKRQTKRKWEWKTGCWHSEKQRIRCKKQYEMTLTCIKNHKNTRPSTKRLPTTQPISLHKRCQI